MNSHEEHMDKLARKSLQPGVELNRYEMVLLSNCWEYCPICKGWGRIFTKAGIPNESDPCSVCNQGGIVWT